MCRRYSNHLFSPPQRQNKSEKRTERQPDWRMKRVFLFLPPPLTHHHPDSSSRLRRPYASDSAALAGASVSLRTQMEEHGTHDRAHVHMCTGCGPKGVHHGNGRVRRQSTQVREQITPRPLTHTTKGGLNSEIFGFSDADRPDCVSAS